MATSVMLAGSPENLSSCLAKASKSRVKPASYRAHGTSAWWTPQPSQRTLGTLASMM
jgi:hypothetical protein